MATSARAWAHELFHTHTRAARSPLRRPALRALQAVAVAGTATLAAAATVAAFLNGHHVDVSVFIV
eukprot:6188731-Pleurochrysis_carterae.AAC.1